MDAQDGAILGAMGFVLQYARGFPKVHDIAVVVLGVIGASLMVLVNHHPATWMDFGQQFLTHLQGIAASQGGANLLARITGGKVPLLPVFNGFATSQQGGK